MTTLDCPRCGAPSNEVVPLPEVAGQEADVVVRVRGLVRVHCSRGHREVGPVDVASRLVAELGAMLLTARRRGWVRRRHACGACGAGLDLLPRHTDTPVPADLDGRVVTPIVEAPMSRCPACGREQLLPATAERVDRVLRTAVDGGPS